MRRDLDDCHNLYEIGLDGGGLRPLTADRGALPGGGKVANRWPLYGPHGRNFFHAVPTPDGRIIAIESTMIEEDAGPIAMLKLEAGPADPQSGGAGTNWDRLTVQVNTDGEPWPYGAFKYPRPIGGNKFVASYTLPAATEGDVDYALYTFTASVSNSLMLTIPYVVFGVFRYMLLLHGRRAGEEPEHVLVTDGQILIAMCGWAFTCVVILALD